MTNNKNNNSSKIKNTICEAFECYENATEKIDLNAGKFGTISLLVCINCVGKFVTPN